MRVGVAQQSLWIAALVVALSALLGAPVLAQSSNAIGPDLEFARRLVAAPQPVMFSVYPEGGNGEVGYVSASGEDVILASLNQLRGDRPFSVHLFTAWSWHDEQDLDAKIARYSSAGLFITLSIKYSPPNGREGDIAGYSKFVETVVRRYGSNPNLHRFVIGNEANVTWGNPSSSDGPFANSAEAIARGTISAKRVLARMKSTAQVGFNIAITERNTDAAFIQKLVDLGGESFVQSVSFLGINVYPGLWPVGSGDAYTDMTAYIGDARYALTAAGLGPNVSLDILENGFPTADDEAQELRLEQMVQAVCDSRAEFGVTGYSWFGLLDADSASSNEFAHYGLLRSDLSPRPSFGRYRSLVADGCGT